MAGVERLELPVAGLESAGLPLTDTPLNGRPGRIRTDE